MAQVDLECPTCRADLPLAGDEAPGEQVFCSYCGAPCVLKKGDDDELEVEEDF